MAGCPWEELRVPWLGITSRGGASLWWGFPSLWKLEGYLLLGLGRRGYKRWMWQKHLRHLWLQLGCTPTCGSRAVPCSLHCRVRLVLPPFPSHRGEERACTATEHGGPASPGSGGLQPMVHCHVLNLESHGNVFTSNSLHEHVGLRGKWLFSVVFTCLS